MKPSNRFSNDRKRKYMKIKTITLTSLIMELILHNIIRSVLRHRSEFTDKTMYIKSCLRPGPCNAGRGLDLGSSFWLEPCIPEYIFQISTETLQIWSGLDPDQFYNRHQVRRNQFWTGTLTQIRVLTPDSVSGRNHVYRNPFLTVTLLYTLYRN